MTRFTFNRGNWEDGNNLPAWGENEEFEDYLKRIGYSGSKLSIGDEDSSEIEIFESTDGKTFYSNISPSGSTCFEVFLPDFPSLMMFIKDHGSAFSTHATNGLQQEILSVLEKFFQIEHGHPAHNICEVCDPKGWERNVQFQAARRKRKDTVA